MEINGVEQFFPVYLNVPKVHFFEGKLLQVLQHGECVRVNVPEFLALEQAEMFKGGWQVASADVLHICVIEIEGTQTFHIGYT